MNRLEWFIVLFESGMLLGLVVMLALLGACDATEMDRERRERRVAWATRTVSTAIVYVQDVRTGLCFALLDEGRSLNGITLVPCDVVQKELAR